MREGHMRHFSGSCLALPVLADLNNREVNIVVNVNVFHLDPQARRIAANIASIKLKITHHLKPPIGRLQHRMTTLEPRTTWGSSALNEYVRLGRHRATLGSSLSYRCNAAADVQPPLLLKQMEQVVTVRHLAGDDLFLPLIISDSEGNLHRLIG